MLLAYGLVWWVRRPGAWRPGRVAVVAALLLFWGGLTFAQSRVWRSSETLWTHVLKRVPDATVALNGRALAHLDAGRLDQAAAELERSLQADSDFEETWSLRARLAYRQGDLGAAGDFSRRRKPRGLSPLLGADLKAKLRSAAGDHRGAILALSSYVELQPSAPDFYRGWLGRRCIWATSRTPSLVWRRPGNCASGASGIRDYLSRNDPIGRASRRWCGCWPRISARSCAYDFAREMRFWVQDEDRALQEYNLILVYFEDALACWHRAAAIAGAQRPLSAVDLKNFDRKLGIVAYNKGCILWRKVGARTTRWRPCAWRSATTPRCARTPARRRSGCFARKPRISLN